MSEVNEVKSVTSESRSVRHVVESVCVGCDYDEFKPWTYRGVYLEYREESPEDGDFIQVRKTWQTKSPVRDKNNAISFGRLVANRVHVLSSWDNFVTDALNYILKVPPPESQDEPYFPDGVSEIK